MADGDSPFLAVPESAWLAANRSAFAIPDRFPVSAGHALVVQLVEGGGTTHTQFLAAGLADELHLVIAPFLAGSSQRPAATTAP